MQPLAKRPLVIEKECRERNEQNFIVFSAHWAAGNNTHIFTGEQAQARPILVQRIDKYGGFDSLNSLSNSDSYGNHQLKYDRVVKNASDPPPRSPDSAIA